MPTKSELDAFSLAEFDILTVLRELTAVD